MVWDYFLLKSKIFISTWSKHTLSTLFSISHITEETKPTYTELDLGIKVKLFFRLITGEGFGLGAGYSFLLRLGEAEGNLYKYHYIYVSHNHFINWICYEFHNKWFVWEIFSFEYTSLFATANTMV